MQHFILFYTTGLILCLGAIFIKIRHPELESIFLISLSSVITVPIIKEAFSELKNKKILLAKNEEIKELKEKILLLEAKKEEDVLLIESPKEEEK